MSDVLKKCPFCGGEAYDERHFSPCGQIVGMDEQGYFIGCGKCGFRLSAKITHARAIEAWNTRAKLPEYYKLLMMVESLAYDDFNSRAEKLLQEIGENA